MLSGFSIFAAVFVLFVIITLMMGVWQVPHGDELYAFQIRQYTTTKLTAEQIHEIGLKEVARINSEMQKVMEQVGFKGTKKEFFQFLRERKTAC